MQKTSLIDTNSLLFSDYFTEIIFLFSNFNFSPEISLPHPSTLFSQLFAALKRSEIAEPNFIPDEFQLIFTSNSLANFAFEFSREFSSFNFDFENFVSFDFSLSYFRLIFHFHRAAERLKFFDLKEKIENFAFHSLKRREKEISRKNSNFSLIENEKLAILIEISSNRLLIESLAVSSRFPLATLAAAKKIRKFREIEKLKFLWK